VSELIEELRKEHAVIAEALAKVNKLGITSEKGQMVLLAAKNGLLAHLEKEDEQLYPVLHSAAEHDADLKRILDLFAKDMDKISKAALEFFEKYATGGSGIEFAKDFGGLLAALSIRIGREESILYRKYDELKR